MSILLFAIDDLKKERSRGERGMFEKIKNSKIGILLLLTGAVYFFLKYISPLVAPALVAMLFVTIFGPLLKKIQAKTHIHRQLGAVVLLLLALVLVVGLVWILCSWIAGSLPEWVQNLEVIEDDITIIVHRGSEMVGRAIGVDAIYLEQTIMDRILEGMDYIQMEALPGMLSQSLVYVKVFAAFGGFLVTFIIAAVLLAKDYDDIMNRLLDREECHVLLEVICGVIRYIATFVKAQGIIMSIIAAVAAFTLTVLGIQHGVLWGILAGLMDVLPFVGTGIVLIPLALMQLFSGHYGIAIACAFLYVACIFLRELLEPKLIGKKIGVTPIAVLISLYAGIQLFGVWGIIKGPLGFVLIYQTYMSLQKRWWQKEENDSVPE